MKPYVVGGLSWKELAGSLVPLEDFPHLFVHALMVNVTGDRAEIGLRGTGQADVDALLRDLSARDSSLSPSDLRAVLVVEAGRLKIEDIQRSISLLVAGGNLHLIDPVFMIPTDRVQGALVRFDEAARLLGIAEPAVATATLGAATATRSRGETAEQRQDRRLQMCIDAGMEMPVSLPAKMPRGIGKIANAEGISRAAFTADVKAAIARKAASRTHKAR